MKPMNQHIPDVNRKGIVILTNQQLGSSVPQCHDLTMTISQKKIQKKTAFGLGNPQFSPYQNQPVSTDLD